MNKRSQLIVALDVETLKEAKDLVRLLGKRVTIFKVGIQLFTACGQEVVQYLLEKEKKVFLDLKFHDIPNTVAKAVESAVGLAQGKNGIFMLTLHAQGGVEMLRIAVQSAAKSAENIKVKRPLVVAVTVLTSEGKRDNIRTLVLERAQLAQESGCDGVVASVEEAPLIREKFGPNFLIVTPGIRPVGAEKGDQKRIATPKEAIEAGSDYLVVGRPIVQAHDPLQVTMKILEEIDKFRPKTKGQRQKN